MLLAHYYTHKPGGFCTRLYRLLVAHAARAETRYLTLDTPPVELPGVRIILLPFPLRRRSGWVFWSMYLLWAPLFLLIVSFREKPKTILCFGPLYSFFAAPAKFCSRARIVLFCRSDSPVENRLNGLRGFGYGMLMFVERIGLIVADRVVMMQAAMLQSYEQFLRKPLRCVQLLPNDIPRLSSSNSDVNLRKQEFDIPQLRILLVGRLTALKNFEEVIDAVAAVNREQNAKCLLTIIGDGPSRQELVERSRRMHVENSVCFETWTDELPERFREHDLLILPSRSEGMSNVALEALACGLPVLFSDIAAHRAVAEPVMLFTADAVELAQKLSAFAQTSELLIELRVASKRMKERFQFDWEARALSALEE